MGGTHSEEGTIGDTRLKIVASSAFALIVPGLSGYIAFSMRSP